MGYDSWATNVYNTIAREAAERKAVTDANRVTSNTQQSVSFIQYNNSRFGLTIQYPSNWEKIDVENGVSFLSPLDNPMDKYREGVSVQIFNHQGFSLEQYVQAIVNDLSQKTQLYGTNSNPSNLAGYPAIEFHC